MNSRVVITVLVAMSIVLAGCSGGPGGASAGDETTVGAADEPTGSTNGADGSAADGTSGEQSADDREATDGGGDADSGDGDADTSSDDVVVVGEEPMDGDVDGSALGERHTTALLEAGSFTTVFRSDTSVESADGTDLGSLSSVWTTAVDLDSDRGFERQEWNNFGTRSVTETYYSDGVTYFREGGFGPVTTQYAGVPSNWGTSTRELAERGSVGTDLRDARFVEVGRDTYQGVTVTRYEFEGIENFDFSGLDAELEPVSAEGVVLVGTDGIVRMSEVSAVVENTENGNVISIRVAFEWSDVGSTTVAEPDWVTDASGE